MTARDPKTPMQFTIETGLRGGFSSMFLYSLTPLSRTPKGNEKWFYTITDSKCRKKLIQKK